MTDPATGHGVSLYWLPLGAGDAVPCVRWNGRLFEALAAGHEHRAACDLYHSALEVRLDGDRFAIELAPAWGGHGAERGVVATGPVGLRALGRSRLFRYEVRRWRGGAIPDASQVVGGPRLLASTRDEVGRLLGAVADFPALTWGRDDLGTGDMWNYNSLTSWVLTRAGLDLSAVGPPPGGRAPGWDAGIVAACRGTGGATYRGVMDGESSPAPTRGRVDPAEDVVAQGRLRGLLRANRAVVGDLSLPVLLRRIVEAACELADARYAALGIIDEAGGLEQFVHAGMPVEVAAAMDHLPEGKGLLGALIADPRPIRLDRMATDPRSVGFPAGHPPMDGFLGVPIRVRNKVFGNLYLTESTRGGFTVEDEELVLALAATAGVAIENARLYQESRQRQDWLQASTEVTQRLLSAEGEEPLRLISRHARRIAGADIVAVVLPTPDPDQLSVEVATGRGAEALTGRVSPVAGTLVERALVTGRPVEVADLVGERGSPFPLVDTATVGPVMVLPLGSRQRLLGALVICRSRGSHAFTPADLEMASTFAGHATVAMELAAARADQQRIARLEDRNRIARDLHDHVVQRLYAIGLTVHSVATGARPDRAQDRLDRVVTDLDETMRQIRTSIFDLRGPLGPQTGSVRAQLLRVAADATPLLGFDARLRFAGPVDSAVPDDVTDDLVAVLREALANTARHAHADRVDVELTTSPTELTLEVADNGVGIGDTARRSGLDNLRHRAERREGALLVTHATGFCTAPANEGTRLRWTIPLP